MRGVGESTPDRDAEQRKAEVRDTGQRDPASAERGDRAEAEPAVRDAPPVDDGLLEAGAWRRFLFVPVTFPLTVGGTTFAFFVGFRAEATSLLGVVALSVAGLAYAALTGLTVYASARVQRRASPGAQAFLERIAGILLTAIAVTILASGATRLVVDVLEGLGR